MTPEKLKSIIDCLRKQGKDDAHYEAKACSKGLSNDVWESVSAFGNTNGGTLLLGLAEESGFQLTKSFPLDLTLSQFVEGIGDGGAKGRKVENPPQYKFKVIDFEGGQILVIKLEEVEDRFKPCYMSKRGIANGSFKRVGDRDIKLSATEIFEMQHILTPSIADKEPVLGATKDDLDSSLVESLLTNEKEKGARVLRGVQSQEEAFRRLNITTVDNEISLAGLLCLGLYPQQFFPKLAIDIAVHPGIKKSEPGAPRFLDRVICEGSISEMVDEALLAVAKNLRTFSYVKGAGRRDELEIPREVLREAIANAVVHREYSIEFLGQAVSVDVFLDRVEITSPGGLWGGKTVETLGNGESRCRNAALIKLAARLQSPKDGAPVEGQGSGIPLMFREMQAHALNKPKFIAKIDSFKVILQRGGVELAQNKLWLDSVGLSDTDSKNHAVLLELRRRKQATVQDLHTVLGFDSDEIRQTLEQLSLEGLIKKDKADTYSIVKKDNTDAPKRTIRDDILRILDEAVEPMGVREIALLANGKVESFRAALNKLVTEGLVTPTAPPTNPKRKYFISYK